jgi:hypothetical protein
MAQTCWMFGANSSLPARLSPMTDLSKFDFEALPRGSKSPGKLTIEDTLDTGLPHAYGKAPYEQKCSAPTSTQPCIF